jgi:predicted neuraminidase
VSPDGDALATAQEGVAIGAVNTDGEHFRVFAKLEDAVEKCSYPAVIQGLDGSLEMTYTWQRKTITYAHLHLPQVPKQ